MRTFTLFSAIVAFSCQPAAAEQPGSHAEDEAAIRKAVESYVAAFNRGDAEGVAAHWSTDGEYASPSGERFKGRPAILAEFKASFAESKGQRVEVSDPTVRFIAPNVAVEEGTARVTRAGEAPDETSYMAVHVKQDGKWKIDSVREIGLPPAPPSHRQQLKELEWMIGEWIDQDENATIRTNCQWSKNKNFITRSFAVSIEDRIELEGTQVIGWDPAGKHIRSWVFDSHGCYGEGVWTRKDNRWIVKTWRVLGGGERASAVNIITYVDEDKFTWQSTGREIDGELQPNIDEVTVVRK